MGQQLRLTLRVQECSHTLQEWQRNGIPEPGRPRRGNDSGAQRSQSGGSESDAKPPRKVRILALLSQDPQRRWKARQVADGLADPQLKSVRVALDEMMRAGSLVKHEDATYQYPQNPGDTRHVF